MATTTIQLSRSDILANLSVTPHCINLEEQPSAPEERQKLKTALMLDEQASAILSTPLNIHLAHGLAYTVGSALGSIPPSVDACLAAFTVPNKVKLTAGARAWSKHAHRSLVETKQPSTNEADEASPSENDTDLANSKRKKEKDPAPTGWWGTPSGPVAGINEKAVALFWKITNDATWRNLHWLPHSVLVYEIRIHEGYGMRWSQDQSASGEDPGRQLPPWVFRGFVEPMMENGHELGWRHAP
ncbi:hypothetical protein GYMLUDRAFT_42047 [Collybiopsis luxurians FD-317 M1]|uniref:Uncharacterized protein n=1 Tax=Collybiopsis luxurians FD-317 M1 TaxID=944289 RepID=A0A0D0CIS7_9AGAR|nr:hypothetical protein GYMLUDRAFT_42047 [Collybiopsis luxurians FD-317 M1]